MHDRPNPSSRATPPGGPGRDPVRKRGRLSSDDVVGRRLRQVYDQALAEPLSADLEALARRLAEQDRSRGGA